MSLIVETDESFEPSAPIRMVAFDVAGTLLTPSPPVAEVYAAVAADRGVVIPIPVLQLRFQEFLSSRRESTETNEEFEREYWQGMVRAVMGNSALAEACFEDLYQHFARSGAWKLFDDVPPVLRRLREMDVKLAVASNFDSRLHSVMAGHPELEGIRLRIISSEVGWRKPHQNFYRALLEQSECEPDEILMIGDDYHLDVNAAQQVGLHALFIKSREVEATDGYLELSDIPDVVRSMSNKSQ